MTLGVGDGARESGSGGGGINCASSVARDKDRGIATTGAEASSTAVDEASAKVAETGEISTSLPLPSLSE